MQITIFGLLVVAIGIWCQFRRFPNVIVAMFGLMVFGSAAAIDLPALGGASVTPANLFLLFYLLRLVSMRGGAADLVATLGPKRPLFIFLLLIVWICASAILLPRLFDGATQVFSLARTTDDDAGTSPLRPTSGNISQAVYAIGGFVAACITCVFAQKAGGMRAILVAICAVTSFHIAFAILDLLTAATHTGFLLDLIHTASYAFLTDDELGGLKRLSGSFSEASAFATFTLTLIGVNFTLFVQRVRPRFTGIATVLLTAFTILSTSSAGYAGLAVFFGGFLVVALWGGLVLRQRRITRIAVGAVCVTVLCASTVVLFLPKVSDIAQTVVAESLLNKATTDSAIERGSWNAQALQVFQDTYGLGAGIGATRGSNYALVLLSNLGLAGFLLFVVLVWRVTLTSPSNDLTNEDRGIVWAARIGILVTLVPSLLIGTVYDLGTLFYCLIGVAAAGVEPVAKRVPATAAGRSLGLPRPLMSNTSFRGRA